jgi:hypothetical protein
MSIRTFSNNWLQEIINLSAQTHNGPYYAKVHNFNYDRKKL